MILFILSFVIFSLAIAGLAIGVILGGNTLRPSCGGDVSITVCPTCPRRNDR